MYKVPFAALSEKEGAEYLSETHKIRIIPSLTTLKNIQDSPEDYHSNTGALVIGNPKVNWLQPLPGARKEAEMVGRLVGVPVPVNIFIYYIYIYIYIYIFIY